jgi:16S rRNA (cytidine1402-2'-O)-methyltransferase
VAAALSVAGDAHGSGFVFRGFLPARGAQRQAAVAQLAQEPMTQVLFEAPHRMEALRRELAEQLPDRTVTVCKELTKQFESIHTLSAATLIDQLGTEDAHPDREAQPAHERGEFVLVVHAATPRGALDSAAGELDASTQRTLSVLLQELPVKQAVALTAQLTGASRNTLYEAALRLRNAT